MIAPATPLEQPLLQLHGPLNLAIKARCAEATT
jgi:hypothetical protein